MKTDSPMVWVVQESNNDYAPAEQFGTVRFITKSDLRVVGGTQSSVVEHDIRVFNSIYEPGLDYIVPAGNPMVTALVCLSLPRGIAHKFLKWDGRRAEYLPFTLDPTKVIVGGSK